ncbi:hypothetical protein ACIGXM_03845 [Kitasatospora sp. NPDC052896]|uniref:hypothetical protein n=1 Tax=Kitasatospora sp. NPDC052896 TaxID=3364061 RepID=UPI0037C99BB1
MPQARPLPNVTDERLCWLVVRDELHKKSSKLGVFGWITILGGGRRGGAALGGDLRREQASGRMGDYALAVDDAASTLSADERGHLRATGQVPEWFMADVERRYQEIHRRR